MFAVVVFRYGLFFVSYFGPFDVNREGFFWEKCDFCPIFAIEKCEINVTNYGNSSI